MFTIQKAKDVTVQPEDVAVRIKWPWSYMDIGDMVTIDDADMAKKAKTVCHVYGHQQRKKFATRTIDGVLHVWRTE